MATVRCFWVWQKRQLQKHVLNVFAPSNLITSLMLATPAICTGRGNTRPNVLALLACNLTWSDQAKLTASVHSIPNEEVESVRKRMGEMYQEQFVWPLEWPPIRKA